MDYTSFTNLKLYFSPGAEVRPVDSPERHQEAGGHPGPGHGGTGRQRDEHRELSEHTDQQRELGDAAPGGEGAQHQPGGHRVPRDRGPQGALLHAAARGGHSGGQMGLAQGKEFCCLLDHYCHLSFRCS